MRGVQRSPCRDAARRRRRHAPDDRKTPGGCRRSVRSGSWRCLTTNPTRVTPNLSIAPMSMSPRESGRLERASTSTPEPGDCRSTARRWRRPRRRRTSAGERRERRPARTGRHDLTGPQSVVAEPERGHDERDAESRIVARRSGIAALDDPAEERAGREARRIPPRRRRVVGDGDEGARHALRTDPDRLEGLRRRRASGSRRSASRAHSSRYPGRTRPAN